MKHHFLARKRTLIGLSIGAMLAGSFGAPALAVDEVPAQTTAAPKPETTRLTLPLSHSTDLKSALTITEAIETPVIAYAFDNAMVVGEFSPLTGISTTEYLELFHTEYGTSPEVTGVVVEMPTERAETIQTERSQIDLGAELPEFDAEPVVFGGETLERKLASEAASDDDGFSAKTAGDWRPDSTTHNIMPFDGYAMFAQVFTWTHGGVYSLPDLIGLEFEINQDNPGVATPQNIRPACFDSDYKKRFWAQNQNYSWSVTDYMSPNAASFGAYADYNDLSDLCRTSSIAIGLRYPQNLTGATFGATGLETKLDTFILAPRGFSSSVAFSGNVQAVSSFHCVNLPAMTLTDCMGVYPVTSTWGGYPSGNYNRGTLAAHRGWTIPSKCWITWNHGSDYQQQSC